MPSIMAWWVASRELAEDLLSVAKPRQQGCPPFQSVRAGETPPCLHTTSRCTAPGVGGGGGRGGGGGGCIGDPWLDSPQKGFADRSPKTKPGNGVHHKYCLVLFGALQSNAQVWLVGCQ